MLRITPTFRSRQLWKLRKFNYWKKHSKILIKVKSKYSNENFTFSSSASSRFSSSSNSSISLCSESREMLRGACSSSSATSDSRFSYSLSLPLVLPPRDLNQDKINLNSKFNKYFLKPCHSHHDKVDTCLLTKTKQKRKEKSRVSQIEILVLKDSIIVWEKFKMQSWKSPDNVMHQSSSRSPRRKMKDSPKNQRHTLVSQALPETIKSPQSWPRWLKRTGWKLERKLSQLHWMKTTETDEWIEIFCYRTNTYTLLTGEVGDAYLLIW